MLRLPRLKSSDRRQVQPEQRTKAQCDVSRDESSLLILL
jgi:hypothetical protein